MNRQHLSEMQLPIYWRRVLSVALVVHSMQMLDRRLTLAHTPTAVGPSVSSGVWARSACQLDGFFTDGCGHDHCWQPDGRAAPCGNGFRRSAPRLVHAA